MKPATAALAAALALDVGVGEGPLRWHPVAGLGSWLQALHRPLPSRSRRTQLVGGALALGEVTAIVGMGAHLLARDATRRGLLGMAVMASVLKWTFSARMLLEEAIAVASALECADLTAARRRLRSLVSRPVGQLEPDLLASAAIESLAENLSDSIVAPLLYYAAFGLPGAAVYRVVNTADAMYGYHGDTEWLGKAAARTDDVLNWLPSRLSAALLVLASATQGWPASRAAITCWRRDAATTASPNAGRPMAAMAGALRRRLEKQGHHVLGADQPRPTAADVRRAARLTGLAAAGASVVTAVLIEMRKR